VQLIHELFFLIILLPLASQSYLFIGHHYQQFFLAQKSALAFLVSCTIDRWHLTHTQLLPALVLLGATLQAPQLLHPVIFQKGNPIPLANSQTPLLQCENSNNT